VWNLRTGAILRVRQEIFASAWSTPEKALPDSNWNCFLWIALNRGQTRPAKRGRDRVGFAVFWFMTAFYG